MAMVAQDLRPSRILTRAAFENAVRVNAAIGGSTNAAIHLIALAQALDLRGVEQASPKVQQAHALIRARVAPLDRDRRMDRDIASVVELIRSGELSHVLG